MFSLMSPLPARMTASDSEAALAVKFLEDPPGQEEDQPIHHKEERQEGDTLSGEERREGEGEVHGC